MICKQFRCFRESTGLICIPAKHLTTILYLFTSLTQTHDFDPLVKVLLVIFRLDIGWHSIRLEKNDSRLQVSNFRHWNYHGSLYNHIFQTFFLSNIKNQRNKCCRPFSRDNFTILSPPPPRSPPPPPPPPRRNPTTTPHPTTHPHHTHTQTCPTHHTHAHTTHKITGEHFNSNFWMNIC